MNKEQFASQFRDSTFSLAKALQYVNIAKQYFEDVKFGTGKDVKNIFNRYIDKCDWIIRDVKDRLSDDSREQLISELEDSLIFDSITDKLIYLSQDQRNFVEDLLDSMIKGEDVKIVE